MGSQENIAAGAAVLGMAALGTAMVVRHRRPSGKDPNNPAIEQGSFSWFSDVDILRFFRGGVVGVFELHDLDRLPRAKRGGSGALRCSDTERNVSVESLVDVPGLVLYSVEILREQILLIFMQVPSVPDVLQTPFLDRGVRALAEIGSKVYVTRLETVQTMSGLVPMDEMPREEGELVSIVWNTGRCGSTLLHKMLQRLGVLSLSEPYWFDRVCELQDEGIDHETIGSVFGVCAGIDVLLARRYVPSHPPVFGIPSTLGSRHVSFNPKGHSFKAMEPIMRAMPHAKHLFMYRDARKVVESFGSIFHTKQSVFDQVLGAISSLWRPNAAQAPSRVKPQGSGDAPTFSTTVKQALVSGKIVAPSNPLVRHISIGWMEAMCLWKELIQLNVPEEGCSTTLRMEDFTRKDPELIESVLKFVLGADVEVGEDALATALKAFEKHSQAGDLMEKSSHMPGSGKEKYLTPADEREIVAVAAAVPTIGSPGYVFADGLGAPARKHVPQ